MKKIEEILSWLADNQRVAYSSIRIFLGVVLFVRGYILMANPDALVQLAGGDKYYMWFSYITISHLVGGLFIAFGLFTRMGALFQIPVLAGAVFIIQDKHLVTGGQSIELAAMVLFLLLICFTFGGGKYALGNKTDLPNF